MAILIPLTIVGGIVFIRDGGLAVVARAVGEPVAVGATDVDAAIRLEAAAAEFERATAKDGSGFTFTVDSRSTLHARQDGPKIEVPDPVDPTKSLGLADEYYVGGSTATGFVAGADFFLQMRHGSETADAPADFENAEPTLAALVRDGKQFRNDGEGWYATDQLPGIGLDPPTIERLPTLLREATDPAETDRALVGNQLLPALTATGKVADAPGLMAVDAAPFTQLAKPITFAFDEHGRLAQLTATMRNTNSEMFDLMVVTVLTFEYDEPLGELPDPAANPAPPPPTPEPDPATEQQGEEAN